jgi:hypothetical protein
MDATQIIQHFGSGPKAAAAIGLKSASALYQWRRSGRVPELRQVQVEHLTGGQLKADAQAR